MRFFMHSTPAAHAALDPLELHRFHQLTLDFPSAPAYPFLGRNRRPCGIFLVIKSEKSIVAVVECPDSRVWGRHGGDGLQLDTDDIVAEVVELCIGY